MSPNDVEDEKEAEVKALELHRAETQNILLYTFLMLLAVLTIWKIKYRKNRCVPFLHETGLTLFYGMLVGAIIKFATKDSSSFSQTVSVQPVNRSLKLDLPPDYLRFIFRRTDRHLNKSSTFLYRFDINVHGDSVNLIKEVATFDPEIFFNILLPPIIFHAGYSLKRGNFFRNIGSILTYAVIGTTMSTFLTGLIMYGVTVLARLPFALNEAFLFGAIISATDPVTVLAIFSDLKVDVDLFALVFGESALNDAVAIVLCKTIENYSPSGANGEHWFDGHAFLSSCGSFFAVFFCSLGIGALFGCITALFTKFTRISESPLLETILFILMSYASFLVSESAGMTGIVSVLFCGICQAHYTYNNLSNSSQVRTKQFFEVLNFLSENFIFTYIGVSLLTSQSHSLNYWFLIGAFIAIFVSRSAFVYLLTYLLNVTRRPRIPMSHQHMILFCGLRGAMAFALAIRNTSSPERRIMYTTTSVIVVATVFFNGSLAAHLVSWLNIK